MPAERRKPSDVLGFELATASAGPKDVALSASTSAGAAARFSRSRSRAVPPGYPVIHDFVPDLEGFYEGWLGRELPRP